MAVERGAADAKLRALRSEGHRDAGALAVAADGGIVALAGASRLDTGLPVGAAGLGVALPEHAASISATTGNPSRTSHWRRHERRPKP